MATVDILTLSSSPPRPFRIFTISSSPPIPSPRGLCGNSLFGLLAGDGSAPISQNVATLGGPILDDIPCGSKSRPSTSETKVGSSIKPKKSKPTKTRLVSKKDTTLEVDNMAGTKEETAPNGEDVANGDIKDKIQQGKELNGEPTDPVSKTAKKPRKSRAQGANESAGDGVPKAKAVRKPRAKKTDVDTQGKIPRSRVTKSSVASKGDSAKSTKSELVSRHFSTADVVTKPPEDPPCSGLLEAVKRRSCWTPPKPSTKSASTINESPSNAADESTVSTDSTTLNQKSGGFTDLFGSFKFSNIQAPPSEKSVLDTSYTKKRKLIEMVSTTVSASKLAVTTPKTKAPKKKAKTITEHATSAYSLETEPSTEPSMEPSTEPAPILKYFSQQTSNSEPNDGFKIPTKPRSKATVKKRSKRGNGTAQAPILLSPGSALKQVDRQEFVFGTSSQLAREESPTFLRDIHAAMQASNELDGDDPFAEPFSESGLSPIDSQGTVPFKKRNLWSAASRSIGAGLLDVEMVDLAHSPAAMNQVHSLGVNIAPISLGVPKDSGVWRDIEELVSDAASPEVRAKPLDPPKAPLGLATSCLPSEVRNPGLSPRALRIPQSSETVPQISQPPPADKPSEKGIDSDKPDYSSYTSAELAKEIASYRFKPVKNRDHMITLLERCWEGKQRMALGSLETNTMLSTSSEPLSKPASGQIDAASPKRSRGRPRKDDAVTPPPKAKTSTKAAKSTVAKTIRSSKPVSGASLSKQLTPKKKRITAKQPVDEISDSDGPLTPSPPRRRPSQIRTPELPLKMSSSATIQGDPELTPTSSQIQLFEHITRAVTQAPPSKDTSNPTWHEKILLYDPIILEDLTVWLNTGALEKAGWDGEVHPGEVKKWCISKSICCLWKENLRGVERTRY